MVFFFLGLEDSEKEFAHPLRASMDVIQICFGPFNFLQKKLQPVNYVIN